MQKANALSAFFTHSVLFFKCARKKNAAYLVYNIILSILTKSTHLL